MDSRWSQNPCHPRITSDLLCQVPCLLKMGLPEPATADSSGGHWQCLQIKHFAGGPLTFGSRVCVEDRAVRRSPSAACLVAEHVWLKALVPACAGRDYFPVPSLVTGFFSSSSERRRWWRSTSCVSTRSCAPRGWLQF